MVVQWNPPRPLKIVYDGEEMTIDEYNAIYEKELAMEDISKAELMEDMIIDLEEENEELRKCLEAIDMHLTPLRDVAETIYDLRKRIDKARRILNARGQDEFNSKYDAIIEEALDRLDG